MTVVDLHPEDLLDKEARGQLTDGERARLDRHLARCSTCRWECRARALFAEERKADVPLEYSPKLIAVALGAAKTNRDVPLPATPRAVRGRPRSFWYVGAAVVLVVSAAVASEGQSPWLRRAVGLETTVLDTHEPTSSNEPAATVTNTVPPIATEAVAVAFREPELEAPAPVRVAKAPPRRGPRALFEDANEARRHGDYARAVSLHRELQSRFPSSTEAHVSQATLGRLLLDRGDLASALASFDTYLAQGHGDLDETVMVNRATALDRLGRTTEARGAWEDLLRAFPSSPHAERARAKIAREPR